VVLHEVLEGLLQQAHIERLAVAEQDGLVEVVRLGPVLGKEPGYPFTLLCDAA
jgi:hypothetical protein